MPKIMRNNINKLSTILKVTFCLAFIFLSSNIKATESLPLTQEQISKLQHLFPSSKDQVLNFQTIEHEHVIWQQKPIDIILPVGKERMIGFPGTVDFGYDKTVLSDDKLSVQNNNGTLYLVAKTEFSAQRVQVRCRDSGQIILLNLSAQKNMSNIPLDIVISDENKADDNVTNSSDAESIDNTSEIKHINITAVTLTRFAAQQLYAPKRLLVQPSSIYRVPMHTAKTVPLVLDGSVIAMPLASWRGGDLFVTAILLRNQLKQELTLDPRNLCGNWKTASFFPSSVLTTAGTESDSTTVFLVSNRPFAESMQICTRGY